MSNLEKKLWALRNGEIDFGAFVTGTRSEYRSMACYLLRKWAGPEWFSADDVEQELYIETWHHIWGYAGADGRHVDFDATRGVTLSRWIVFGAMVSAKRALHKARGVTLGGSPDRKPSRYEMPATALGEEGASLIEALLAEAPTAERVISDAQETRRAATRALRSCESPSERYAVLAIREAGSLDGAASVLYEDPDHRTTLRLGCEEAAEKFVARHASRVARRIDAGRVNPG